MTQEGKYFQIVTRNTITPSDKTVRVLGPHIWNNLPQTQS